MALCKALQGLLLGVLGTLDVMDRIHVCWQWH